MNDRPWTPVKVEGSVRTFRAKRTCERCHRPIGDTTEAEMDAVVAGAPLPSVAAECGCAEVIEKLAMFSQMYDAIHHGRVDAAGVGHPTWDELGPDAREEYLKEAKNTVRAMVHLGWAPLDRVLAQIEAAERVSGSPVEAAERERDIVDLTDAAAVLRHATEEDELGNPIILVDLHDGDRYAEAIDRAVRALEASR